MRHLCGRKHPRVREPRPTMADGGLAMAVPDILDDESAAAPATAPGRAADEISAPTHDEIAALAYSYWEARGGEAGSPWEDWFRAEREFKEREQRENSPHRRDRPR